jgi:hypothetical protein
MKRTLLNLAVVALTLGGCANSSGARMGLFTTTMPMVAIVGAEVFAGESVSYIDGTGTIKLKGSSNPRRECDGDFHYESERLGVGTIRCADGIDALFQFRALSTLTGYGFGRAKVGDVSFAYGFPLEQAEPYLRVPPGKKLQRKDNALLLTDS